MTAAIAGLGALVLSLSLVSIWRAIGLGRRGRVLSSLGRSVLSLLAGALGVVLIAVALNLWTYVRVFAETPIAAVSIAGVGGEFRVSLTTGDEESRDFALRGDEWQLDARILKWRSWAVVFGLDTQARLERLSGRYRSVQSEPPPMHILANDVGLDLWKLAQRHSHRLPVFDTVYGGAVYMPMVAGAQYDVSITPTGLVARPTNAIANQAVANWR
ncbi:MAG: cation/multidrug efflux pump [Pseudomonadota bacterium]